MGITINISDNIKTSGKCSFKTQMKWNVKHFHSIQSIYKRFRFYKRNATWRELEETESRLCPMLICW